MDTRVLVDCDDLNDQFEQLGDTTRCRCDTGFSDSSSHVCPEFMDISEECNTSSTPVTVAPQIVMNDEPVATVTETIIDKDSHCHRPLPKTDKRARNQLIAVSVLCFVFMMIEIAGGLLSNSLALLTDATHLASDLSSFFVGLFAIWLSQRPATVRMSYGFHRADVVGALISILIIWVLTGVLIYLAVDRVIHPDYEINANQMLLVAALGVAFNIVMGLVLSGACFKCSVPHGHSHFGGGSHGHSHGNAHGHSHGNAHGHSHENSHGHSHENSRRPSHENSHGDIHEHSHGTLHASCVEPHAKNKLDKHAHRSAPRHDQHNQGYDTLNEVSLESTHGTLVDQGSSPETPNQLKDPNIQSYNHKHETPCEQPPQDVAHSHSHDTRHDQVARQEFSISTADDNSSAPGHSHQNMNVRAALIHVLGDLVQSIGVLIAAIIIKIDHDYKIADPICTFVFSVLVLFTTITVMRDIFYIFMEAAPHKVDHAKIKNALEGIIGVKAVHSLHVWGLTMSKTAMSVHLAIAHDAQYSHVLKRATRMLRDDYGGYHVTVQVEPYQPDIMKSCDQCLGPKLDKK